MKVPETALELVTEIENAILSLDEMSRRGAKKTVIVIAVRYSPSEF